MAQESGQQAIIAWPQSAQPVIQTASIKSLAKKVSQIIAAIDKIAPDARNNFNKYDYQSANAIAAAIRAELALKGLAFFPEVTALEIWETKTRKGEIYWACKVMMRMTLVDSETGEQWSGSFAGAGMDEGDKHVWKAVTGGCKYFLRWLVMAPEKSDPEADEKLEQALRNANKDAGDASRDIGLLKPSEEPNRGHGQEGTAPRKSLQEPQQVSSVKLPIAPPAAPTPTAPPATAKTQPAATEQPTKIKTEQRDGGMKGVEGKVMDVLFKQKANGGQKYIVAVMAGDIPLYCFDTHVGDALKKFEAKGKNCLFECIEKAGAGGKPFLHIEDISFIGGVELYKDSKTHEYKMTPQYEQR